MIKTSIEKLAKEIGFDIGNSDDIVQSDLINGLSSGLSKINDDNKYDMQVCYITEKLTKESFKLIRALNEFVNIKEQEVI